MIKDIIVRDTPTQKKENELSYRAKTKLFESENMPKNTKNNNNSATYNEKNVEKLCKRTW